MSSKAFTVGLAAFSIVSAAPVTGGDHLKIPAIVGGEPAVAGDFPFIVSTSGGVISEVDSFHLHPGFEWYNQTSRDNDVGVLKLRTPIVESSTIKDATLAAAGFDPVPGTVARVAGWGHLDGESTSQSVPNLRKVDVPIISRAKCIAAYQTNDESNQTITSNAICAGFDAGGKDSCYGDSGGPMVDASMGTLIGVVSGGYKCALPCFPGPCSGVGAFRDFIDQFL